MEPHERAILNLVRIIGVLLVVATLLALGFYWAQCAAHKPAPSPVQPLLVGLRLIPSLLGFLVLIKARSIVGWISELLEL